MAGPNALSLARVWDRLRVAVPFVALVLWRSLRQLVFIAGLVALVLVLLALTRIPYEVHRFLGNGAGVCHSAVEHIVVLGGSGMPSGPELLRLHRAASLSKEYPESSIVVVHPQDPAVIRAMVDELVMRGVLYERIEVLAAGDNTREQALLVASKCLAGRSIALVTAPENMYRSVLSFRKAGLQQVCGVPAWDHAQAYDFRYRHQAIGGKTYAPDVSGSTLLRYTFWNYLKLEVSCIRELIAIAYYRLNGWI